MEMPVTPTGMPVTPTAAAAMQVTPTIYAVTHTDYVLVGSTVTLTVKTATRPGYPRVPVTGWFAVGGRTDVIDGVAPDDGDFLVVDKAGYLRIYVLKQDIAK